MEVSERPRRPEFAGVSTTQRISTTLIAPLVFAHQPCSSSLLSSPHSPSVRVSETETLTRVSAEDSNSPATTVASKSPLAGNRLVARCRSLTSHNPSKEPSPRRTNHPECDGSPETSFRKSRKEGEQVFASKNVDEALTPIDVEATSSDNGSILSPIRRGGVLKKKRNSKDLRRKLLTKRTRGKYLENVEPVEGSDALVPEDSGGPPTENESTSNGQVEGKGKFVETTEKEGKRSQKKHYRARSLPVGSNDSVAPRHRTTVRAEMQRRKEARRTARELRAREEVARRARAAALARQASLQERAARAAAEEAEAVRRGLERLGVRSPPLSLLFMNARARHTAYSDENPLHESHDGTMPLFASSDEGADEHTLRRLYVHMLRAALDSHCHRLCCQRRHAALRCQWWRVNVRETPCIHQRLNALPQFPMMEQSATRSRRKPSAISPMQRSSGAPLEETSVNTSSNEPLWKQYVRRLPWPLWPSPLMHVRRRSASSPPPSPPPPPPPPPPPTHPTPEQRQYLLSNISPASSLQHVHEGEQDASRAMSSRRGSVRWCCW